ncbi:MAG TPA: T9SS type A sorting domain-containing protein [Bacteroidetes bacterium]|nr:T9SS type A sorting domain-containing protein [Bacteroidota bacterium]
MDVNFVAIKIGDASGDAIVNSNGIESRNTGEISFVVENTEISSNEEIEIPVLAKDFAGINGFQTTIAFNPGMVQFENIESGVLNINNSNIATNKLAQGYVPVSWFNANAIDVEDNAVLFTLKFKSLNTAKVSAVLSINSDVTKTEAYDSELNKLNIALEYRNNDVSFELMQNRPNPFANTTQIAFNIPENTDYSLNIFDITGKLVYKVSGQAEKGFNTVEINKAQLNATGVLYYTLSAGQYTATKKMVVIK